jgi:hypothetical protein
MGKWLTRFKKNNYPETPNQGTDVTDSLPVNDIKENTVTAGQVIRLHRMRSGCIEAGHCFSLVTDCPLYPVRPGWCRERLTNRKA